MQIIPILGNKTTNYTVQGLNEHTVYTFTVYASTRIGAGPSSEATAQTDEYCKLSFKVYLLLVFQQTICYVLQIQALHQLRCRSHMLEEEKPRLNGNLLSLKIKME